MQTYVIVTNPKDGNKKRNKSQFNVYIGAPQLHPTTIANLEWTKKKEKQRNSEDLVILGIKEQHANKRNNRKADKGVFSPTNAGTKV
jgi:hypothetical protein